MNLPQLRRRLIHMLHRASVNLFQRWNRLMANAVTAVSIHRIRSILAKFLPARCQICLNLFPVCCQQRPDHRSPHRRHPRKSLNTRSARQMKQHRLRLVPQMVRHCNLHLLPGIFLRLRKKSLITQLSPRFFFAHPMHPCIFRHPAVADMTLYAALPAKRPDKRSIPI